jgi:hypothetical protein
MAKNGLCKIIARVDLDLPAVKKLQRRTLEDLLHSKRTISEVTQATPNQCPRYFATASVRDWT